MPSPEQPFMFDVNFSFGQTSVFTEVNNEESGVIPPPVSGTFTLLDGTPFLLLSGQDFVLL
tara:strand:- start:665 stop:847 length:183 start_codon:yes stop_codon:yes gene_type:complete